MLHVLETQSMATPTHEPPDLPHLTFVMRRLSLVAFSLVPRPKLGLSTTLVKRMYSIYRRHNCVAMYYTQDINTVTSLLTSLIFSKKVLTRGYPHLPHKLEVSMYDDYPVCSLINSISLLF